MADGHKSHDQTDGGQGQSRGGWWRKFLKWSRRRSNCVNNRTLSHSDEENRSNGNSNVTQGNAIPAPISSHNNEEYRSNGNSDVTEVNAIPAPIFAHSDVHQNIDLSAMQQRLDVRNGFALLINHYSFDLRTKMTTRDGAFTDVNKMEDVMFEFGFKVNRFCDENVEELHRMLKKVANEDDLRKHDCLMVVIGTHGTTDGGLYARDKLHNIRDIWEPFINNTNLNHLTKIFIVQACRGNKRDDGIKVQLETTSTSTHESCQALSTSKTTIATVSSGDVDTKVGSTQRSARKVHPDHPNVLIAYSTNEGYVSGRSPTNGSYYLQTLRKMMYDQGGNGLDFVTLLTRVNKEMSRLLLEDNSDDVMTLNRRYTRPPPKTFKQAPSVTSSLTYKVFLHRRKY